MAKLKWELEMKAKLRAISKAKIIWSKEQQQQQQRGTCALRFIRWVYIYRDSCTRIEIRTTCTRGRLDRDVLTQTFVLGLGTE